MIEFYFPHSYLLVVFCQGVISSSILFRMPLMPAVLTQRTIVGQLAFCPPLHLEVLNTSMALKILLHELLIAACIYTYTVFGLFQNAGCKLVGLQYFPSRQ